MTLRAWACLVFLVIPAWAQAQDVGVIKGRNGCPAGAPEVVIEMDNEDYKEASSISGWVGATTLNSGGNVFLYMCKTPAAPFLNAPGPFAVFALGLCPAGSFEVRRRFDVEDDDNRTRIRPDAWSAWPSQLQGDVINVHFCVFQGVPGGSWPQLGKEYGVFSDVQHLPGALEFGRIYTDDEDASKPRYSGRNANRYYYARNFASFYAQSDPALKVACCTNGDGNFVRPAQLTFLHGEQDTTMRVARVTSTPPPSNPVAICVGDPPSGVNYLYASFADGGSYARNGKYITSYSWQFPDGTTGNTPGPYYFLFVPDQQSESFQAILRVTDNAGEVGVTSCSVSVYWNPG